MNIKILSQELEINFETLCVFICIFNALTSSVMIENPDQNGKEEILGLQFRAARRRTH